LERYKDAIVSFNKAIQLRSDFHEAWYNCSDALARLGSYEDGISNCDEGLIYVLKDSQPEGWGELHYLKGEIYSYQAHLSQNISGARLRYSQALDCYEKALQTLEFFPKKYLKLIQSLIKTYLGLAKSEAANQWRIKGLEVFRQLLNAEFTPQQKRRLEVQFSGFSQVAVDALISAGNLTIALETAERYKNRCLIWILDEWREQVTSPSYSQMRQLLGSNYEIIYWHLSEDALTTFILTSNKETPTVLTQKSTHFETWQKEWDKRYSDYRSKDQVQHPATHPWREKLEAELTRLKAILEIDKIEVCLGPKTQLILIPHRDLHRFPIHALFGDRVTTYLPSIQVGRTQKSKSTSSNHFLLNVEDPTRSDQPPLEFAQLESAIIQAMLAPNVRTINPDTADRVTVESSIQEHHGIFHFTGHGAYNERQPENSSIGLANTDRLTAKEISALNLQQYKLVCLSACETALSGLKTINTEYVGLTSAFLQAGVSQIVSTLWTVQEVSNAYLIIHFYQCLKDNIPPARALRQSQSWLRDITSLELADWLLEISRLEHLDLLIKHDLEQRASSLQEDANSSTMDSHRPPYQDPYYWAAFTLTGRGSI
jgi:CHAT domain-containing protein